MKAKNSVLAPLDDAAETYPAERVSVGSNDAGRYLVHVPDPFRPLDRRHTTPIALADLLTDATIEHVRQAAHLLQSQWYCHGGRDFTQWGGFSLGKMVAGPVLRNELHRALSNYFACRQLLQESPEATHLEIREDPGIVTGVWIHECERQGISWRLVVDQAEEPVAERCRRRPLRQRLTHGLTRLYSAMGRSRSRHRSGRPLAMLVCGSLTFRHTDFCAELDRSPDFNVVRNRDALSTRQRRRIERRTTAAALTHFANLWDALHGELTSSDVLSDTARGGDDHVVRILRDTFLHRLPQIAATIETARATLSSRGPTLVITEAQPGNEDYVWASVARSLGIRVVAITNELWGLPMHAYGFPPMADNILLTSPLSRPWWLAKGFSEDAILPARSRYLDTPIRERQATDEFVVLCAVTRYGPELMDVPVTHPRRFVQSVISIAQSRPDVRFVVKFHPGTPRLEGQTPFARQIAFVKQHAPPNVELAPLESDLQAYLQRADCLLCSSSSFTIFQALAQGIPCILAPPDSTLLDQCPFFQVMKSRSRVTGLENIAAEIDALRHDGDDVPTNWSNGVFYAEPRASDVVARLLAAAQPTAPVQQAEQLRTVREISVADRSAIR